ncbi:MAG TPA: hypothetical protein VF902_02840, partial [Coriobacteriia bacterium]
MISRTPSPNSPLPPACACGRATARASAGLELSKRVRASALLSVALVVLTLATPAVALAATKAPALKALSWVSGAQSDGSGIIIVTGQLPDSVPLPANIVIPVPSGAQLAWVGEIVGGDASKDPTATYSIVPGT